MEAQNSFKKPQKDREWSTIQEFDLSKKQQKKKKNDKKKKKINSRFNSLNSFTFVKI